jgi:PHD/YefM family antitoxin component YafN of YafNO toxin-antitoxin module
VRELRAQDEATEELLRIPGLLDRVRAGLREVEEGKTIPLSKLRRKY